jgi:putative phage-type endonuclease
MSSVAESSLLTPEMEERRAQWLEERKSGLGGSDAAAAIGVDPYKDRLQLWSEKVGLLEMADLSGNEAVEAGIVLERTIGEWYAKKTGRNVTLGEPFTILRSQEHDFMFATLDATQVVDGRLGVVQIKNTSFPAEAWEEELPANYEAQLTHEMIVAGVSHGTLVALHRGQKLRFYDRELTVEAAQKLVAAEREFWSMVTSETPPEAGTNSEGVVKALFPRVEIEDLAALSPEADDLDAELAQVKEEIDRLEGRRSQIESQLKLWIGTRAGGLTPQGVKFSWKGSEVHYKPQDARTVYVRRFTRSAKK